MLWFSQLWFLCSWLVICSVHGFDLWRDHSGASFFDGWDFFGGWDNLTLGDIWWLNASDAFSQGLAYINSQGNAVIKVDNTSFVPFNQKRNSVRITTQEAYGVGSLWIFDVVHLPWGCSVWPAIWSFGPNWPIDGEIDIVEGINNVLNNQMALHTIGGCGQAPDAFQFQTGSTVEGDCSVPQGCTVAETKANSYQSGFAAAGGGVWAAQVDVSGIYIWFWSRPNVPLSILESNSTSGIDISGWGLPSASYPSTTCNIPEFFSAQNLVIDITLCGNWAGIPALYDETCATAGPTGICYNDNVVGNGSNYANAYFEISHVRVYTTGGIVVPTSLPNTDEVTVPNYPVTTTIITAWTTTQTVTFTEFPGIGESGNTTDPPVATTTPNNAAVHVLDGLWWLSAFAFVTIMNFLWRYDVGQHGL